MYAVPGITTLYTYDAFGRQIHVVDNTASGTQDTDDAYDDAGRLVCVASPEGVINYEYDPHTGALVRTYTGASDPDRIPGTGDGKAVTDTRYQYDVEGRLTDVSVYERNDTPLPPETTHYAYDLMGNLEQVRLPNGVISDYDYDAMNRLVRLRQYKDVNHDNEYTASVDQVLSEYDYTLALDGKRTSVTETDDQHRTTQIDWLYDNLGRLTGEAYDSYDNALDYIARYTYDLVGNRQEKAVLHTPTTADFDAVGSYFAEYLAGGNPAGSGKINFQPGEKTASYYDAQDRLALEAFDQDNNGSIDRITTYAYGPGAFYNYGYNSIFINAGTGTSLTEKTVWDVHEAGNYLNYDSSGSTAPKLSQSQYTYDARGRMVECREDADGDGYAETDTTYSYDADGARIGETQTVDPNDDGILSDATVTDTHFLVDKQNPTGYSQVLEQKNASGAVVKSYTLGLDVIAQSDAPGTANAGTKWLLYDGHGSTRRLVDLTGLPLTSEIYRYDAFGNPIGFEPGTAKTSLLYSGEQTDRTGLQYLRARYYDPAIGRLRSFDGYVGDPNEPQTLHKYLYCHANPINLVDPSGQSSISEFLTVLSVRAYLMALEHPVITGSIGFVINTLIPMDIQEAMIGSGIPPFELIGSTGRASQGFLRSLVASKNPMFTRLVQRIDRSAAGLLANKTGKAFQEFFKDLLPEAEPNVVTVGKHTIDYVWKGWAIEIKSGKFVDTAQLAAAAKYAKTQGLTLVYYFLTKPPKSEIKKVINAGGNVISIYEN
jgi:RHS repeat-associated protein